MQIGDYDAEERNRIAIPEVDDRVLTIVMGKPSYTKQRTVRQFVREGQSDDIALSLASLEIENDVVTQT